MVTEVNSFQTLQQHPLPPVQEHHCSHCYHPEENNNQQPNHATTNALHSNQFAAGSIAYSGWMAQSLRLKIEV
uniref:Uncharacterized protein n=1 Tax=Arundo donax TaxID=35708 RepID=A0A0A9D7J5_ARUDO